MKEIKGERIEGFAPFWYPDSRLLILGSFPSVKSRAEGFYYGNPQNRFWRTVCGFFGEETARGTEEKKDFLRRRQIALWDVVLSCEIAGSADASIREERCADVAGLVRGSAVEAVLCNGKTAYSLLMRGGALPVRTVCMPSTSPANPRFSHKAWERELGAVFGGRDTGEEHGL